MNTPAKKIALLFPGQGSQVVGMGRSLVETDPIAAQVFREADGILDFPLSELCWYGPAEELKDTFNTQPALLTHSIAVLRAFQSRFPGTKISYTAGHSVGEFAALVAAGALTFQDALLLVRERGRVMKEAGEARPGGMAAVLGLDLKIVNEICGEITSGTESSVFIANDNCPGQVVISGEEAGVTDASEMLKASGARKVVRLAVSIASHCPLMSEAQEELNKILEKTPIMNPKLPIVGNVNARLLNSAKEIMADLNAQLISRVRWNESMRTLISCGLSGCYELGPGDVLKGLMRRIDPSIPTISLNSPSSLFSLTESHPTNNPSD
jgi:[acyl-carrier-protein] S-malonyltransferase